MFRHEIMLVSFVNSMYYQIRFDHDLDLPRSFKFQAKNGLELFKALRSMFVFSFRIPMDLCVDCLLGSHIAYCFDYHSCFGVRQVSV